MTRRQIREHIFKLLFNLDFYLAEENEGQMELYFERIPQEEAGQLSIPPREKDGEMDGFWYRIRFEEEEEAIPEYASGQERAYIAGKLKALCARLPQIDEAIDRVSKGWRIRRMAKADLAILRLAVYEVCYDEDIPTGVAINEAVELAKRYGSDASASFINGILAKFARGEEKAGQTERAKEQADKKGRKASGGEEG